LLRFFAAIVNLITPGAGLILMGRWLLACTIQLLLIGLTLLLCWLRLIFEPTMLEVLLGVTGVIYLVSTGLCFVIDSTSATKSTRNLIASCAFAALSWSILVAGFIYKHHWLGIHIYFVPSMSMNPTLKPGEFILVDTWIFQEKSPKEGDVVVFQYSAENHWLVKRIAYWPEGKLTQNNEYFMLGDNTKGSLDSRRLGGVQQDQIIGKVKLVLLGVDQEHQVLAGSFMRMVH
jgi:signal peptidase I